MNKMGEMGSQHYFSCKSLLESQANALAYQTYPKAEDEGLRNRCRAHLLNGILRYLLEAGPRFTAVVVYLALCSSSLRRSTKLHIPTPLPCPLPFLALVPAPDPAPALSH